MLKHIRTNKNTSNDRNKKNRWLYWQLDEICSTEFLTAVATLMSHHWEVWCKQVNNNLNKIHNKHFSGWSLWWLTQTQSRLLIVLMIHWKLTWFSKKKEGNIKWMFNRNKWKEMDLHFTLLLNLLENRKRHFIKLLFNGHIHLNHTCGLMAAYYYLYLIRSV